MEQTARIIESFALLLWPVIVIILIVVFRPAVASIVESARSRKFTLKVGGQELTMEEANEQQRTLISDLQAQVIELRKKIEGATGHAKALHTDEPALHPQLLNTILWVDDVPKNNSYFIDQLAKSEISVDLALSTSEGIAKFERGAYRFIISDMGRVEGGLFHPYAGIDLLQTIRKKDPNIPFIIFTTHRNAQEFGKKAKSLGATAITSSHTDLFAILKLDEIRRPLT